MSSMFLAISASAQIPVHTEVFSPANVWRTTLEQFWNERDPVAITFFERNGMPVHAYAVIPSENPAVHRVDLTPAAPIEYLVEGQRFDPPRKLKGAYDYHNPAFREYREKYLQGKVIMRNYDAPPPLRLDADSVQGVVDLFLLYPDVKKRDMIRVTIHARREGSNFVGRYEAFDYWAMDEKFAPRSRWGGAVLIEPVPDAWRGGAERALDPAATWPQQHGPLFNGSAMDCATDLVDTLADARLQWVADLPIPGGRGEIPRSPFGFFPLARSGLGITQYSAPIVAEGRVFLAIPMVDEEALAKHPQATTHPRIIRGVDPRAMGPEFSLMRDTLLCFDAETGRLLWRFSDSRHMGLIGDSKSGRGLTAAYAEGKVVFRGQTSVYCVDAANGRLIWRNDGQKRTKEDPGYSFAQAQPWSTDHSPIIVDKVVVTRINDTPDVPKSPKTAPAKVEEDRNKANDGDTAEDDEGPARFTTLVGLDLDTGRLLWRAQNVAGEHAIPTAVVLDSRPYLLAAYQGNISGKPSAGHRTQPDPKGMLSLIDPKTGRIVWQHSIVGPNSWTPLVWEDVVGLNVERDAQRPNAEGKLEFVRRLGAVRVSTQGAVILWKQPEVEYPRGRFPPIAHRGVFLVDSRETGFQAVRARTGEILGRFPHIYHMAKGSHNWTWMIASNGKVITSGAQLLLFRLDDREMVRLPGELPVDLASGYVCPIRPAMADGRLFLRTFDSLICYDLRKLQGRQAETLRFRTGDIALGMQAGEGSAEMSLRLVDGRPATLSLRFPLFQETGVRRPYDWGGPPPIPERSVSAAALSVESDRIRGEMWVAVNDHREPWTLNLRRERDRVSGECVRRIPAIESPVTVSGAIEGEVVELTDRMRWILRLVQAAVTAPEERQDLTIYLEQLRDGTVRSYASGGRITQASFEADASRLTWGTGSLHGEIRVIIHGDRFKRPHPEFDTAVAADYTVEVEAEKGAEGRRAVRGRYRGTFGVEHLAVTPIQSVGRPDPLSVITAPALSGEVGPPSQYTRNNMHRFETFCILSKSVTAGSFLISSIIFNRL